MYMSFGFIARITISLKKYKFRMTSEAVYENDTFELVLLTQ